MGRIYGDTERYSNIRRCTVTGECTICGNDFTGNSVLSATILIRRVDIQNWDDIERKIIVERETILCNECLLQIAEIQHALNLCGRHPLDDGD